MKNFAARLDALAQQVKELKIEFYEYINDDANYSLEERWEAFRKAPFELVCGENDICISGEDEIVELLGLDRSLNYRQDLQISTGDRVNMCYIVDKVLELHIDEFDLPFNDYKASFGYMLTVPAFQGLLENILCEGVRDFTYDW